MHRRAFLSTMAGGLLAAPLAAEAQQSRKVYRLGVLNVAALPASSDRSALPVLLATALRELGYAEGQNLLIERRGSAVLSSPLLPRDRPRIIALAGKHRLPSISNWREYAEQGGLMAYGSNQSRLSHRLAIYVDRILKGASPAGLPVEQPTAYELVINLKTAKALGLTIPDSLLRRADEVIQ